MAHYHSLTELYLTRLREFYRQPARIFWVYGFPTILAIGLGMAFRNRPTESIAVDLVRNEASPPIEKAIDDYQAHTGKSEDRIRLILKVVTPEQAKERLRNGETPLVVEPVDGRYAQGPPAVTYRYDPTRPEATTAKLVFDDTLQRAFKRTDPVPTRDQKFEEPGSRYIDFLIPGLIGLNTMGGGLWGVGFLLVNFRMAKLLKRFMATPMPRRDFLMAILGARLTFLIPDVGALMLLGIFMFGMPVRGNILLLTVLEVIGGLAFAGIGLLVASRARTTETVSGLMNLVMLPMWLFSGVFFKSEHFPPAFQPFIQALPLTQLVSGLRMIMLRGAGIVEVGPALLILTAWAVGTFWLALKWFRWT
ncbi:MAG TPA: ABC transporter permease [Isosphaeraceae bacterium]|jgi:ABC-type multidrug transport system permease subunit|nr:ABC transporter permease [Isosphaeraceae bacterium]